MTEMSQSSLPRKRPPDHKLIDESTDVPTSIVRHCSTARGLLQLTLLSVLTAKTCGGAKTHLPLQSAERL